jgi:3-oxoadipate enol-lactonase
VPATAHFELSGRAGAPVLVLSNSLGTTLDMWEAQLGTFTEHFRVVRYDQRGHGSSSAPLGPYRIRDLGYDVLALLDRLEFDRVSFCGLSLGGMIGMWLASHAPDRIDRLALLCTSARLPPEPWAERAATVRERGTEAIVDTLLSRWFTPTFRACQPATTARFAEMLKATADDAYAACCAAIEHMDLRSDLSAIRAPTLVVAGAEDRATPPADGHAIAHAIAGARIAVLNDAAHLANVERPDATTELLLAHFRGASSA